MISTVQGSLRKLSRSTMKAENQVYSWGSHKRLLSIFHQAYIMSPSSSVSELSSYSLMASTKAEIGTIGIFLRAVAGAPTWRLSDLK